MSDFDFTLFHYMHDIWTGDYFVDIGGQWVHGQKDNVAFNLAYPLGLLDPENETLIEKLFDSSGNEVDSSINKYLEMFFSKYFEEAGGNHVTIPAETSYGEYIGKK